MMGAVTPKSRRVLTVVGTAWAASSVLTVTRTSSEPARASSMTWLTVEAESAVSVLVMDCTTMGFEPPTWMPPMLTAADFRRGDAAMNERTSGMERLKSHFSSASGAKWLKACVLPNEMAVRAGDGARVAQEGPGGAFAKE